MNSCTGRDIAQERALVMVFLQLTEAKQADHTRPYIPEFLRKRIYPFVIDFGKPDKALFWRWIILRGKIREAGECSSLRMERCGIGARVRRGVEQLTASVLLLSPVQKNGLLLGRYH